MGVENLEDLDDHGKEELRDWASFRAQTLSRTSELQEYRDVKDDWATRPDRVGLC